MREFTETPEATGQRGRADADLEKDVTGIVEAARAIHETLGRGLPPSVYEAALAAELAQRGRAVRRQVPVPIHYKSQRIDPGFFADLVVDERILVEILCVEELEPVHEAVLRNYLRHSGLPAGLVVNFRASPLEEGIVGILA